MKYIQKQREPITFAEWLEQVNQDWRPTYDGMPGDIKRLLAHALMEEQGHICCYCEGRLSERDCHIEHLRPQSEYGADALNYQNILCSCQNQVRHGEPLHCGNAKGNWYVAVELVSPLDPSCEERFGYTAIGGIHPRSEMDRATAKTIEVLRLDIDKLRAFRAEAITPFLDPQLTQDEMRRFMQSYLLPDAGGRFNPFFTTIRYLFSGL